MSDNYRGTEDILSDESFLSWYFKTGDGRDNAWKQWMASHPESDELVKQAIDMMEKTRLSEKAVPIQQARAAETRLLGSIERLTGSTDSIRATAHQAIGPDEPAAGSAPAGAGVFPIRKNIFRWMAAASVMLVLAAGWLFTAPWRQKAPEAATAYGQIGNRQLPDGTEVVMNANSRLRYSAEWKDGTDREVWVNGEAFFHVKRTPQKSRFIVHTEHFDIIVTGTQFNVVNRHGKDNVLLQEGSVTLRTADGRTLQMRPGDFVAYDSFLVEKKPVRTDSVLAWKEQKLVLDHTPIRDLVTIIKDHYGINVRLEGDSTGDHKVSAVLPNNNLEILLQTLEATGDFDIDRSKGNDGIVIKARRRQNQN